MIVPTGVGVNRVSLVVGFKLMYCPHGRGGEPRVMVFVIHRQTLSPRAWG